VARFQLTLNVTDLQQSVEYYTKILGCGPDAVVGSQASFTVEDPCIRLELRSNGETCDLASIGIEYNEFSDLDELVGSLLSANLLRDWEGTDDGGGALTKSPDGLKFKHQYLEFDNE